MGFFIVDELEQVVEQSKYRPSISGIDKLVKKCVSFVIQWQDIHIKGLDKGYEIIMVTVGKPSWNIIGGPFHWVDGFGVLLLYFLIQIKQFIVNKGLDDVENGLVSDLLGLLILGDVFW